MRRMRKFAIITHPFECPGCLFAQRNSGVTI
jgi:hypothetical protein